MARIARGPAPWYYGSELALAAGPLAWAGMAGRRRNPMGPDESTSEGFLAAPPPALVAMVGPPGTGKSHLARLITERTPVRVVESDDLRRVLASRPAYTADENRRVFAALYGRVERHLRRGQNVLLDATNIYEWSRQRIYRLAERTGARLLLVRTIAPDEVVERRLGARRAGVDPRDGSEAGWDVYVRMRAEFQEIQRPHVVVDTSQDLSPAVEQIVAFVENRE